MSEDKKKPIPPGAPDRTPVKEPEKGPKVPVKDPKTPDKREPRQ